MPCWYPDAKVIRLEQNYRSTKTILDAANNVIKNNLGRKVKSLWTENDEGSKLVYRNLETAYDEADYIVEDIKSKVDNADYQYKDCAILYRTNAQSRLLEERLVTSNIPYRLVGGINFYARKEIKDLLSYLKTIDNAKDDLAVKRIINVPKRGIGLTTVAKIQDYALEHDITFYEALNRIEDVPGAGRSISKIDGFTGFIRVLRSKLELVPISEVFEDILKETKYIENLDVETEDELNSKIDNIDELKNKIIAYENESEHPSLSEFLEEVALVADIDSLDEDNDRVVLMTLHSAKGLEFPNVYLAGMEDGIFPSYMTIKAEDPTEVEEERRLCYVGITRARENLTLTSARQRMIRGETQYNKPSRFIREIPKVLVDIDGVSSSRSIELPKANAYVESRKAFSKKPSYFNSAATGAAFKKKYEDSKNSGLEYGVGDRVSHIKFGVGTVLGIAEGGRDYEVMVEFDKAGVKKMFASFAKLKKQ